MSGSDVDQPHTGPIEAAVDAARTALTAVEPNSPVEALPLLRVAQSFVTRAIDEAMAAVVVDQGGSIRTAGALAGLSENAVGPRLARTELLAAYGSGNGRVTAAGVERARYDLEEGRHRTPDEAPASAPLRFRARRNT
ncbi:MAG: hypothetical protein L0H96_17960 [Humibacillus sp.]|nr:hypothetical protein [Humibacillus sp.]MDN5778784.1 hypothetical protein [Humibacillus sp.]